MSTRLGVRRTAEVVDVSSRVGEDGKTYYDIQVDNWAAVLSWAASRLAWFVGGVRGWVWLLPFCI